jgi:hypothetical protein
MGTYDDFFYAWSDKPVRIAFQNDSSALPDVPAPYYGFGMVGYGSAGGVVGCAGPPTTRLLGPYSTFAGVHGTATDFTGVAGTSVNHVGVYGQVEDKPFLVSDGFHAGVLGVAQSQSGVIGSTQEGIGVEGFSYTGYGVFAQSGTSNGVLGRSGASNGVFGVTGDAGPFPGDFPIAGVFGTSAPNVGVLGTSAQFVGVAGISDAFFGVYGRSNKSYAGFFQGDLNVTGKIFAGTKDAIVPFPDGSKRLLHCMESPEHWFEDFGAAKLRRGRAMVKLDVDFAKVIKRGDYKVFLTPEGDCRGLYVRKSAASFEVREFAGGKSSVAFSYRIVGRRKDIRDHRRFAKFDVPVPPPAPRARRAPTRAAFIAELERQVRARATPSMRRSDRKVAAMPPPPRLIPGRRPPARGR